MAKSGQHGGNVLQMAALYGLDPADIIDFSANINPLGMPQSLKKAITSQLSIAEQYPDIDYQRLYQSLANATGCSSEQIIAGNGATELIFALSRFLQPKKALLPVPGFAEYRRALEREGCDIQNFYLTEADQFQLTSTFVNALTKDLDCVFLCTPNNPTGHYPDLEILKQILDKCTELKITLIVDESFIDFMPDNHGLISFLVDYPNLFLLRSLTKFYAIPGLRLGYLLSGNQTAISAMREQQEPWTINAFAALAGEIVTHDHEYAATTHDWLKTEQNYLYQALNQFSTLKVFKPSANYIFLQNLKPNIDLQKQLLERGILIRHCTNYPGLTSDYYRVAIKNHKDNKLLIDNLNLIFQSGF